MSKTWTSNNNCLDSQIRQLAWVQYRKMELLDDWGENGEQAIKVSFFRIILQIPSHAELTVSHVLDFDSYKDQAYQFYGLADWSLETLNDWIKAFKIEFNGERFDPSEEGMINQLLQQSSSSLILQGGFYGADLEFIVGHGRSEKRGSYTIFRIEQELIRTPNVVSGMAASMSKHHIFVRDEALKVIFNQKWKPIFDGQMPILNTDYDQISYWLKQQVVNFYNDCDDAFISDLSDTIIAHEIGHDIIINHRLDPSISAITEASRVFGETIFTTLHEVLADLAPKLGTLYELATLVDLDSNRAIRRYVMYMSDTWFFDTTDNYMYDYSTILSTIMSTYYDGSELNANQLMTDLYEKGGFFDQLIQFFNQHAQSLMTLIANHNAQFDLMYADCLNQTRVDSKSLTPIEVMVKAWSLYFTRVDQNEKKAIIHFCDQIKRDFFNFFAQFFIGQSLTQSELLSIVTKRLLQSIE